MARGTAHAARDRAERCTDLEEMRVIVRQHNRHVTPGCCMLCDIQLLDANSPSPLCSICGTMAVAVMRPFFEVQMYDEIIDEPCDGPVCDFTILDKRMLQTLAISPE
jgi:hypothetical protein